MTIELGLSRVHFPITALGPGRRLGIWFQGCSIRCPGCISTDTWGTARERIPLDRLLTDIRPWLDQADGITISGGEPFDQADALHALLLGLRQHSEADILVYTGYTLEALAEPLQRMDGLIDALMSDPFREDVPQSLALRGSDNQRLSLFTQRGHDALAAYERPLLPDDKALDIMFDADGSAWMAGIPRQGDLLRLRVLLQQQGHQARVSADTSSRNPAGVHR